MTTIPMTRFMHIIPFPMVIIILKSLQEGTDAKALPSLLS